MVGFEDSVNMAEECKNPIRDFPRMMLVGLGLTGTIYLLVSIAAVAMVPVGDLTDPTKPSALTQVVAAAAPDLDFDRIFPFIAMFAVANSALINMLMASRLLYGMANQQCCRRSSARSTRPVVRPGCRSSSPPRSPSGLITYVVLRSRTPEGSSSVGLLGGTTALLLLCVFTVVNLALIILRRREPAEHEHFKAPYILPWLGMLTCAFLAGPWARSEANREQYEIAGYLLVLGIILWAITWVANRGGSGPPAEYDPEELGTTGPVN